MDMLNTKTGSETSKDYHKKLRVCINVFLLSGLTRFKLMFDVYTLWKRQKNPDIFWQFQGDIEVEHWLKMG